MSNELVVETPQDRSHDGKAMASLTERQRKFVQEMLQQGINPKAAAKAAANCGFAAAYGYELMRHEGVLAALREEATKRVVGAALIGVNVLLDIAQSPTHKDQFRAAKHLADINGYTTEQRIMVTHVTEDSRGQIRQIREMAKQLNLDPQALIAAAGIIDIEVEAEFTEVQEQPEDTEGDAIVEVDDSDW